MAARTWARVFQLVESFEDGLALNGLFEYRHELLVANKHTPHSFLQVDCPSERGFAAATAERMLELEPTGQWDYTAFYSPSRDSDPTTEEMEQFVLKCARDGIELGYVAVS